MSLDPIRFDRGIALFGREGQERLHGKSVTIVGAGGVGSWMLPAVALLGPRTVTVVDPQELAETDRNRSGIARHDDRVPGSLKVDLAARLVHSIDPAIRVRTVPQSVISKEGFDAVISADIVITCVDHDALRFVVSEICVAYERPLLDLATDVPESGIYGGRVFFGLPGDACLVCMQLLDLRDVRRFFLSDAEREAEDAVYGVPKWLLNSSGPAVVSLNMAIAGLASTEFMVWATGMRTPHRLLTYYGHRGVVTLSRDDPQPHCYYCKALRGKGADANVERYLSLASTRAAA